MLLSVTAGLVAQHARAGPRGRADREIQQSEVSNLSLHLAGGGVAGSVRGIRLKLSASVNAGATKPRDRSGAMAGLAQV